MNFIYQRKTIHFLLHYTDNCSYFAGKDFHTKYFDTFIEYDAYFGYSTQQC